MNGLTIDREKCILCGKCIRVCSQQGLRIEAGAVQVTENCSFCGICTDSCPKGALSLNITENKAPAAEASGGIWVFAQQKDGTTLPAAFELLGKGRRLAEQRGCMLTAVLAGTSAQAAELIACGADLVLCCGDRRLSAGDTGLYTDWLCGLIRERRPEAVLFSATDFGRELAPGIAVRLGTGLTADCTELDIDPETGLLRQTRPAFGGNLMATIICPDRRPQMATVRPGVFKAPVPEPARRGQIEAVTLSPDSEPLVKILERIAGDGGTSLSRAKVIVDVGRGIGSARNLPLMQRFAALLGASLGCSRPLVEAGWCEYAHQVGQTGTSVAPELLICVGISGAIQHLAGIGGAERIIAINSDPAAPIFGVSDYGLCGDCVDIVKELVKQLEKKGESA